MKFTLKNWSENIVFWFVGIAYLLFFLFVGITNSGVFPHSRFFRKNQLMGVYPARWNYFIQKKLPDSAYKLYKVVDGRAVYIDKAAFTAQYYFGLKRVYYILAAETQYLAADSTIANSADKYTIQMQAGGDINNYLNPDTLHYIAYSSVNVLSFKGKYLLVGERLPSWNDGHGESLKQRTVVVTALNITAAK